MPVSGTLCWLVNVNVFFALLVYWTTFPNASVVGEKDVSATPEPDVVTLRKLALFVTSVTSIDPGRLPSTPGVNFTEIVQVPLARSCRRRWNR